MAVREWWCVGGGVWVWCVGDVWDCRCAGVGVYAGACEGVRGSTETCRVVRPCARVGLCAQLRSCAGTGAGAGVRLGCGCARGHGSGFLYRYLGAGVG